MGCGTSSETKSMKQDNSKVEDNELVDRTNSTNNFNKQPGETVLIAYQRLDELICKLESECPGPRLATAEAWIDHLESQMDSATLIGDNINKPHILANDKKSVDLDEIIDQKLINNLKPIHEDENRNDIIKVRRLAIQLKIAFDVNNAAKQEEFMAKISRKFMELSAHQLRIEMTEHAKNRANTLLNSYNRLRQYYYEQDNLLAIVTGGTYLSSFERQIDADLENARQIRDKLGAVAEQWRTAGSLLRASAKGALQAVEYWSLVGTSQSPNERITLALDCRSAVQESLTAFEGSQAAVPQVEIPFFSPRQASAVRHANIYMLTDMANALRFRHTQEVFEAFQINTAKALEWLQQTYNNTLKKDLTNSENVVMGLAGKLREERINYINNVVGNKMYNFSTPIDIS